MFMLGRVAAISGDVRSALAADSSVLAIVHLATGRLYVAWTIITVRGSRGGGDGGPMFCIQDLRGSTEALDWHEQRDMTGCRREHGRP
jgi:hypothetical protein